MQLHLLQELVHVESGIMVVQSNHKTDGDLVLTQWIHEASTKSVGGQRPAQGVHHVVERSLRLPNLLHAKSIQLRISRADLLPLPISLSQQASSAFSHNRYPSGQIGWFSIAGAGLTTAVEPRGRRPDSSDSVPLDEKRIDGKAGEEVDAE